MNIGIDVGGSHIGIGIVDSKGKILVKEEKDYEKKELDMTKIVLKTIKELLHKILKENCKLEKKIENIGIAFPGTVSNGIVIKAENLGIENFEIVKEIENEFNIKTYLENDAKCAAIAEKNFGSLKDIDDSLFLILGTGVGGAAFLDGKLLKPKRYSGFEVGHMVIIKNGEKCNCGRNGCFETYGSIKRFKQKISKEFNLGTTNGIVIKEFIMQNKENNKLNKIIDEYIENLCLGIANLINILEPEVISIGGSFAHYKDILLDKLNSKLALKNELYNKENIPKIVVAKLKNDAGIIGAAMIDN